MVLRKAVTENVKGKEWDVKKKKYMQGIEPGVAGRLSYIRPKECRLDVESQILFVILVKVVLL